MNDLNTSELLKSSQAQLQQSVMANNFDQALQFLEQNSRVFPPSVFHSYMGTIYAKLGELPKAHFHLLQAKAFGANSIFVNNNLKYVQQKLGLDKNREESHFWDSPKHLGEQSLNFITTHYQPLLLSLIFLNLAVLIFLSTQIFIQRTKKITKRFWAFLCTLLLAIALWGIIAYQNSSTLQKMAKSQTQAVVMNLLELREGPSELFPVIAEIKAGELIFPSSCDDQYCLISSEEVKGWALKKDIRFLK